MDRLGTLLDSTLRAYADLHPGKGLGLAFGLFGGAAMVLSVVLYTPRNRWGSFAVLGPKRGWLAVHEILGLFGPVLVGFHATTAWVGVAGLTNVAMWSAALSGLLARYFAGRVPLARFRKECLLRELESDRRSVENNLHGWTGRWVGAAVRGRYLGGGEPGLYLMFRQFLLDVGALLLLAGAAGMLHGSLAKRNRARSPRPAARLVRERLITERNLMLLNVVEAGGTFWTRVHVAFSVALGVLLVAHVVTVYLFKPQYLF